MFRFQYPWFALLLVPLVAALLVALRCRPPTLSVSSVSVFRTGFAGFGWRPWRWPPVIQAAGLALCVVALMRPQFGNTRFIERAEGIDIMLVLDVSGTMQLFDVPADMDVQSIARGIQAGALKSRLDVAKEELRKFVKARPDDRIGLIVFARLPYMICPPTLDHDFLINHLEVLEPGMLPDGTNIAGPLASATYRLKDSAARRRVIAFFTDGYNNVNARVTPRQAAILARKFNIAVYTVGIGSVHAVAQTPGLFGPHLQWAESQFDARLLEDMATATGGRYFAARDGTGFAKVMSEIAALEKTSLEVPRYVDFSDRFFPWLVAGVALIFAGFILERTWFQTVP